jgi:hypothetical protein
LFAGIVLRGPAGILGVPVGLYLHFHREGILIVIGLQAVHGALALNAMSDDRRQPDDGLLQSPRDT